MYLVTINCVKFGMRLPHTVGEGVALQVVLYSTQSTSVIDCIVDFVAWEAIVSKALTKD